MVRVLFVCLGNICRSPMAEFILKDLVRKNGWDIDVASAGTSSEEEGNPVYPPAKAELERHGLSCGGKRAVQLQKSDYDKYDLFIGMDSANIRNMTRIAGGTDSQNKIYKMLSFADYEETQRFTEARDVADPWYTGNFDETYEDVVAGCRGFLYYLQQKGELSADVEIPEK